MSPYSYTVLVTPQTQGDDQQCVRIFLRVTPRANWFELVGVCKG